MVACEMKDQVPSRDSHEKLRKTHADATKDKGLGFPNLLMRLARLAGFDGAAGKFLQVAGSNLVIGESTSKSDLGIV